MKVASYSHRYVARRVLINAQRPVHVDGYMSVYSLVCLCMCMCMSGPYPGGVRGVRTNPLFLAAYSGCVNDV